MTNYDKEKVREEIRDILLEITELGEEDLTPDASLTEDLGVDSLAALGVLVALEKKYKIKIEEEKLEQLDKLSTAIELVFELLDQKTEIYAN